MANGPTRASGYGTYASDSTSKFTPELFSRKMLRNFYETTAFSMISNTDYEGDIRNQGDKVIIRRIPVLTINDYEIGGTLTYQVPEIANRELNIDQAKSWSYRLDDIDKVQSDLDLMNKFSADAGERLTITIDKDCFEYTATKADASNKGATAGAISGNINLGVSGTPMSVTKDNATDLIVDLNLVLDEANIPSENRWVVLPAWYCALLKKSDLKAANITGDSTAVLRSGVIGMIDRTKVIQSNNLYHVTDTTECFYCQAGTADAMTFANQLVKSETLQIPDTFGTYVRVLSVYGREVVQPTAMATLYATKG